MFDPERLVISIKGRRYEGALLHGAGGVCATRETAARWLRRCQSRGRICMVHLNFSHLGSEQLHADSGDITIHQSAKSQ
jgi:hypothetical protein